MKRLLRWIGLQQGSADHQRETNHYTIELIPPWENQKLTEPTFNNFPSYFRSFTQALPNTPELERECLMPLGFVIEPGKVADVPLIDYSKTDVPRCSKCQGFLSCFCTISADRMSWKCGICGNVSNFSDRFLRNYVKLNEMECSVYDIKVPRSYANRPQGMKSFLFLIDISKEAILSGFTSQFIETIESCLDNIPNSTSVAIVTSGKFVSVYDIKNMRESVIPDPAGFVGTPNYIPLISEVRDQIKEILNKIKSKISTDNGNCYLNALTVAGSLLRVYGGIIVSSCAGIPSNGSLAIKSRLIDKPNATEVELLNISVGDELGEKITELALKLNRRGISVHLFSYSKQHTELAMLGAICSLTGGKCYYYKEFDPVKFNTDVHRTLTDRYKWNSSMKFRCSPGIHIRKTFGSLTNQNETAYFPVLTSDAAITFALTLTSPITTACFQAALVWSLCPKQCFVRVFNFKLPVSSSLSVIMRNIDETAMTAFFAKHSVTCLMNNGNRKASSELIWLMTELAKRGAEFHSIYYLIHALTNNPVLTNVMHEYIDERMANILNIRMMSAIDCLLFIYPRLINLENQEVLRLKKESISHGIFALHEFNRIVVWGYPESNGEKASKLVFENEKQFVELTKNMMSLSGKYLPIELMNSKEGNEYALHQMHEDCHYLTFDSFITMLQKHTPQ